ncbi:MAG: thioredoxin family protein [gamma proteobacterium symbiont of Bathyaustriella thionipta]|nr:thioredoxin family protein [gamma proteobacterium symbiont of Bathyaustriella thionipta]MCU7949735.1 thioredoxin family protein [gamma proteobacterium symbiont of Bathyaustriella thionipta]MCU7952853.1 thioredoxin family protein [gamma proteobacterium symbiont of Bathyaustriella thionipta]MCU7956317.1 thioredoxin family protein [gamma proteobacterium symbiont of Bathyaustriella thionipta]MCU7968471.1 thioredoxin family protein [gamma proteobacterium symbiont of Bathyaustriella thionipta]
MNDKRQIEIFSADCPLCQDTIDLVNDTACPSCEISVINMNDTQVAKRAKELGIKSIPAVVINGNLADCCAHQGVNEEVLRTAGIGQPLA